MGACMAWKTGDGDSFVGGCFEDYGENPMKNRAADMELLEKNPGAELIFAVIERALRDSRLESFGSYGSMQNKREAIQWLHSTTRKAWSCRWCLEWLTDEVDACQRKLIRCVSNNTLIIKRHRMTKEAYAIR